MGMSNDYRATIYGRPATIRAKLSLFDNHIAPYVRPQELGHFVERVVGHWKEAGLSTGTVKTLFCILKDFVKFSYKE